MSSSSMSSTATTYTPTLHMLCGKIASGKSTLAAQLASQPATVLISEDDWLSTLYADQLQTGADYLRCSAKLHATLAPHVTALLNSGVSVVLDFAANTPKSRQWMRDILDQTGVPHQMHLLLPPDELCLTRLRQRNKSGDHPFAVSEAQFHQFSKHFQPPIEAEGFTLIHHD